jgi:transposase
MIRPETTSFTEEEWAQTPPAVQEFVLALLTRVQTLEAEVQSLREQVNRNSRNSSMPPSSDGPRVPPKKNTRASGKRKRGGQSGHAGMQRQLVPPEELTASYDLTPPMCGQCGHPLAGHDPTPYQHQVIEIPRVVAEIIEYRLHTLTCPVCQAQTRATLPPEIPEGAFGPRLQTTVALLSGDYRLSKRKIQALLRDFFHIDLSVGVIPTLERRTSAALAEPVAEARAYVQQQPFVNADETGWREENQKAWLWVLASPLVTVFLIRRSRAGKVARELLGEHFQGIFGADRWRAYNPFPLKHRQLCWAHLLRDFQAFVERGNESERIGQALLDEAKLMFEWWHRVRDGTLSRSAFAAQMQTVQQHVYALLHEGSECQHQKTAGTCRDILKLESALWTFVHTEGVEPTNNLAERQIRHAVLWRKSSFGTQSKTGSEFVERIMTAVATLRQQQRNVLDFLTEACDAANRDIPAPSLLPKPATP